MKRLLGPLIAGLLAALAVGCGSRSALLDGTQAAGLKDNLELVRRAVDAGDCSAAGARLRQLRSEVGNLPGSVDRELRVRLREEIAGKLAPAVEQECDDSKTETRKPPTTPAPTGPTGPAPTPEPTPAPTPEPKTQTTESTPAPVPPPSTETTPPVDPLDPNRPAPEPTPEVPTPDPGGFGESDGL